MAQKLSRQELAELIRKLGNAEGTETEQEEYIRTLKNNLIDPSLMGYIFYPKQEMTPEEIVDKASGYKPIQL